MIAPSPCPYRALLTGIAPEETQGVGRIKRPTSREWEMKKKTWVQDTNKIVGKNSTSFGITEYRYMFAYIGFSAAIPGTTRGPKLFACTYKLQHKPYFV